MESPIESGGQDISRTGKTGQPPSDDPGINCKALFEEQEALRRSEERFRLALLGSTDGLWDLNVKTKEIYFSPRWKSMLGYADDELVNHLDTCMALMHPEDRQPALAFIRNFLDGGDCKFETEFRLRHKDGAYRNILSRAVLVRDADNVPVRLVGTHVDITERKKSEEAVRRFADVVQHTKIGVAIGVEDGTLGLVNPAFAEMHGYTIDELHGRPIADVYAPQVRADVPDLINIINKKGYHKFETLRLRKDGSVFPAEVEAYAVKDNEGRVLYRVANFQDITGRKKEEERLRKEAEHGRLLLELYEKSAYLTDKELYGYILERAVRITDSAIGFFHMISGDQKTVILSTWTGETFRNCSASQDRHYPLAQAGNWADCVRFRRPVVCNDYRNSPGRKGLPEGHAPVARFMSIPVMEENEVRFIMGVGNKPTDYEEHDIVQLQVAVNELHKIIMKRRADDALKKEQLKSEKLQAIGTLAGGIAHDFNNLMQGVFGYISLAKGQLDRKHAALASLEQAEKALTMSISLSSQLLTFSRGGHPVKRRIPLMPLVKNSANFALSGSRSVCRITADKDLWDADADEGQTGQVIQNIVLNANEAMPDGGIVDISIGNVDIPAGGKPSLRDGGMFVRIDIRDSGIGIPGRDLPRIFDPYFTTKQTGSGLGLATSYSIVRNHGGAIEVESGENRGSVFSIYLPAAQGGKEEETPASAAEAARRGRILVMDDDEMVRDVAMRMISGLGHEGESAENGEDAVRRFRQAMDAGRPFDIVILDLTVRGGMGGEQAIRRLREMDPSVKAIVSSGYSDSPLVSNYRAYGFAAVLNKPYVLAAMTESLNALLRRS
ncbi:MAG: PAS domain S-box protein [Nitrospiraceae bacterium]|nr:PAS domain S-box protein [Nitrospiraceae bacterium]